MRYKVILDTNIYIAANYSFHNSYFNVLREKAAAGELELHINSVIEGEVKAHITQEVKKAAKELLNAVKNEKLAGFRNLQSFGEKLMIPEPKDWVASGVSEFQSLLNACNVKRLPLNGIDVEKVFRDYFEQNPPFEKSKPEEFKDAIAVASIANEVCNLQEGELYCVVSNDKGFCKAIDLYAQPGNRKIFSSLQELTNYFALVDERARLVQAYLDNGKATEVICDAIRKIVESSTLDVENLNYYAEDVEVIDVDDIKYRASVVSVDDSNSAKISVESSCKVTVYYKYTDEDQSYFDKEDHVYLWQRIVELEDIYSVPVNFVIAVDISECASDVEADNEYIDIDEISDAPERIDLEEDILVKREIVADSGSFHDEYDPELDRVIRNHAITTCPDCGTPLGETNDGGNGFCVNCAPNH